MSIFDETARMDCLLDFIRYENAFTDLSTRKCLVQYLHFDLSHRAPYSLFGLVPFGICVLYSTTLSTSLLYLVSRCNIGPSRRATPNPSFSHTSRGASHRHLSSVPAAPGPTESRTATTIIPDRPSIIACSKIVIGVERRGCRERRGR